MKVTASLLTSLLKTNKAFHLPRVLWSCISNHHILKLYPCFRPILKCSKNKHFSCCYEYPPVSFRFKPFTEISKKWSVSNRCQLMALNPKGDSAHELRLGNLCPPVNVWTVFSWLNMLKTQYPLFHDWKKQVYSVILWTGLFKTGLRSPWVSAIF